MTSPRIECYLPAGTDSLSAVLPALSNRRVGIEGSPPGWLGTGYRGTINVWPRRFGGPTSPSSGGPCRWAVNGWISAKFPDSTDVSVRTR